MLKNNIILTEVNTFFFWGGGGACHYPQSRNRSQVAVQDTFMFRRYDIVI